LNEAQEAVAKANAAAAGSLPQAHTWLDVCLLFVLLMLFQHQVHCQRIKTLITTLTMLAVVLACSTHFQALA
jgi:hypothetical protein